MPDSLHYRGQPTPRVKINIRPQADFREILAVLGDLSLPDFIKDVENIKYAILECLNNSLRAHREHKVSKDIITNFDVDDSRLNVEIKDFGGGFDPQKLPYRLDENPDLIDHKSSAFQEYQKQHQYQRFGMGLLLVKKTFTGFELVFFDQNGQPTSWGKGDIQGTRILLSTGGE
jgi:anti-sigma regulatory factor (Ser/Thr protein kinase)